LFQYNSTLPLVFFWCRALVWCATGVPVQTKESQHDECNTTAAEVGGYHLRSSWVITQSISRIVDLVVAANWIAFACFCCITSTALPMRLLYWVDHSCLESTPSFALARQWHTNTNLKCQNVSDGFSPSLANAFCSCAIGCFEAIRTTFCLVFHNPKR
jgi:hypothetical protein